MTADISIFDGTSPLRIDKPLRLIELFAGYGSQALALKYLGIPFEHHRISEWAIKSIYAYKELHATDDNCDYSAPFTDKEIRKWFYGGKISSNYNDPIADDKIDKMPIDELRQLFNAMQATNNKGSVVGVKAADLKIIDTDKYTYLMTYSFPCQDLSKSGKQQGMSRDSNTRRGRVGHGTSQTIDTAGGELQGGVEEPKATPHFRIRKLTERECFRLMGMADEDSAKLIATQNKTSLYHLAGDSIVTTVLMAIFGEMFGMDWESKVREHVERLCSNESNG